MGRTLLISDLVNWGISIAKRIHASLRGQLASYNRNLWQSAYTSNTA
jgi:hypothetical protein